MVKGISRSLLNLGLGYQIIAYKDWGQLVAHLNIIQIDGRKRCVGIMLPFMGNYIPTSLF
jgi:hypothetical protein